MSANSYRELWVWQKSFKLTQDIYRLTSQLPRDEQYGLMSQMRRASVSIASNIAEGQQRNNSKEYRQFLGIARGSTAELSTQVLLVQAIYHKKLPNLTQEIETIQKMLYSLIKKL